MRRVVLTMVAATVAATAAACGGADVTVLAQLEAVATGDEEARGRPLPALPVRLLPYDRDALFDSLAQAHPVPEPQIPDTVFAIQTQVGERYREWQQALGRWGVLRDSLDTISRRMQQMSRGSGEYLVLFRDFNDLADEVDALERRSNQAFREFESLQTRLTQSAREIQLERELWADEAFAPVDSIIQARLDQRGGQEQADTTTAQGVARFRNVRSGRWWVYTRFDRPFDELYWNVPIDVNRGDEIEIRLTEENAEVRQKL
jgi:hypothetical protein